MGNDRDYYCIVEFGANGEIGYLKYCDMKNTAEMSAATGHQWDEGKVTKEATKNSDGVRTFTCTVCKKTRTEVVKAVAAISEPSDHVDTSETTQSESLPEKGESAGELQSSNTE